MGKIKKEIKYIGFYDLPGSINKRVATLAAMNKMDYISDALNKAGYSVHIISPSWYLDETRWLKFISKATIQLSEQKRITFCPSFGTKFSWLHYCAILLSLLWLFIWMVINVHKDEKVLVYHVQWLSMPIRWAKKLKGFQLILEVEEIYSRVWKNRKLLRIWERNLINKADCYIAVSDILAEILGDRVKAIVYGNYSIPHHNGNSVLNSKVNVVYAGSIDYIKGGAFKAIECARLLPDSYLMHICGTGNPDTLIEIQKQIEQVNNELSHEKCIYHGMMPDSEFTNFLQKCQIAINPQNDGENMMTLFPSKIVKYLSHNLRVVSTRIISINESLLAPIITFPIDDKPESFVAAILQLDLESEYNSREMISHLDKKFVKELKELIS